MYPFKSLLVLVALCAVLAGCSTTSLYRPAVGDGYGYSEQQLADDRYQIIFKARRTDSLTAQNFALARAAEVTLANGYDWFIVTDNQVTAIENTPEQGDAYSLRAAGNCDSPLCGNIETRRKYAGDGLNIGNDARRDLRIQMNIRVGSGALPDPDYAYDARQVKQDLVPKSK
ncbi:CC0125/CC1285 family lipoprotein [Pseudidiomarina insulisalsae]|uniref:Lipoprotein n=1 Tax=Pseudidiomarina insulisalsae TaxID=575789 RepID=A0A432YR43_9GAMM|nr:hypothetical protein [Pseudidiomarina insulisalsae]RUO63746.1 hypothetical protein CWI71_01390 [Pseudidiomarina insulisalsae]